MGHRIVKRFAVRKNGSHVYPWTLAEYGREIYRADSWRLVVRLMDRIIGDSKRLRGREIETMFGLGLPELGIIAFLVVLIFGPSALPKLGKSLGETRAALRSVHEEIEKD